MPPPAHKAGGMAVMRRRRSLATAAAGMLAIAATILLGGAASAAGSAPRPDLVVKPLRHVAGTLGRGEDFKITVEVKNAGRRKAGPSLARFYLSPTAKRSAKATRLSGKLRVDALRPGKSFRGKAELKVPSKTPLRSLHLIACADGGRKVREANEKNNCRAGRGTVEIRRLTTNELIDVAVAQRKISAEKGLIYKVFAAFGDPRLPKKYKGAPDPLAEGPLDRVIAQWKDLSRSTKKTLGPFLIPPFHEGSYWEKSLRGRRPSSSASRRRATADPNSPWCFGDPDVALEDWSYVEASSGPAAGKVRIWYQKRYAATDAALAGDLMGALESKIWPALTTLMGHEPLPDEGSTGPCAGGSDAVDIALVDRATATTFSHTLSNESTPAEMLFPRTPPGGYTGLKPVLAHEFMHMIQFSYSFASGNMASAENQWLKEGTAQWAMDYVTDPSYGIGLTPQQEEHGALPYFFDNPDVPLDSPTPSHHDYGSYVFWLWAARSGGNPTVVRQAWNAIGSQRSLAAAKSVFSSGWNQAWKDFTRTNWNQPPIENYQQWDGIGATPKVAASGLLPNKQTTQINTEVKPVAAKYLTFAPGNGVNFLTYRNLGTRSPEAGVQAIIANKDGSYDVEDWSSKAKEEVTACNVRELTLVLSNASTARGGVKPFKLEWKARPTARFDPYSRRANTCNPNAKFDVTSVSGGFSWTAHEQFTGVPCTEDRTVDWTTKLAPGNPPAEMNVTYDQNGENPIYGFSTPVPAVDLTATGNGVASQECSDPLDNERCDLHVSRPEGLTIGGAQESSGPSLKLGWDFGYPAIVYGPDNGGTCNSGFPGPILLFHDDTGSLFVSPLNDGTSPAEPIGTSTVSISQLSGKTVTLTLSGSDSRQFSDDQSSGSASWSWSMTATFTRR